MSLNANFMLNSIYCIANTLKNMFDDLQIQMDVEGLWKLA